MRFAFISDIHANLEALEAVLNDIKGQNIDEVICLGDIVGYGANPNECIELIKNRCPETLLGNHDAAAVELLSTQHFNIHAKNSIDGRKNLKKENRVPFCFAPKTFKRFYDSVHAYSYNQICGIDTSLEEAALIHFFDHNLSGRAYSHSHNNNPGQ